MKKHFSISSWIGRGLAVRVAILMVVMLLATGLAVPLAAYWWGSTGATAAGLAGGICLFSSFLALMISWQLGSAARGMGGILLSTTLRTFLPLILALIVRLRAEGLVEAGFLYYLVGFYLLALAVETPLSLPPGVQLPQHTPEKTQAPEERTSDG
jgi:hypothetical protein